MILNPFVCRSILCALAIIGLLPASNALCQKTASRFEELVDIVKQGDTVVVVTTDGKQIKARALELNATAIIVSPGTSQQPQTIPAGDIARVLIPDPVGNGIKIGAGIGAAAGLVSGLLVNTYCSNEVGACPAAVIGLTAAGAAAGAGVGWGIDSSHGNRIVYDTAGIRIGDQPATDFFASVDYSRTSKVVIPSSFRNQTPEQISLSAGIGRHFASGLGVEAEIQRTAQSAVRQNPCEQPAAGPLVGRCIGPGLEGLESQFVGTGRVVYSLRAVRFHPFISGGFSVLRSVERYAYVDGSLKVVQARAHFTDTAVPVGGGFRVALTSSIAIRPAVTYYWGVNRTSVSVGVVYRRR
jgi:hypothetical protein